MMTEIRNPKLNGLLGGISRCSVVYLVTVIIDRTLSLNNFGSDEKTIAPHVAEQISLM